MKHVVVALLLAVGVAVGCGGSATADNDAVPTAAVTAETGTPAPVADVAATDQPAQAAQAAQPAQAAQAAQAAQPAQAGSCGGGPGGSCCGGGDGGSCSQMGTPEEVEAGGGCPCQRRRRLIEKARQGAATD